MLPAASRASFVLASLVLVVWSTFPKRGMAEPHATPPFALPKDWRWDAVPPGVWQARRDFGDGYAVIRALRSPRDAQAPGAALDAFLAGAPGSAPAGQGAGATAAGQHLMFERWTGTTGVLEAVVLDDPAPDGGFRTAMTLTGAGMQPQPALWARDAFDEAVRSVQPSPAALPSAPPPLPPDAGGLDATVTGLHFLNRPDGTGGTDTRLDIWVLLFAPNGRFSRVAPSESGGIDAHCHQDPGDCGAYRLLGDTWFRKPDRIEMREGSGRYGLLETRELPFARRGNDIDIGGTHLHPAAALSHGAPLEGVWRMLSLSWKTVVRRELAFGHDGCFRQAELEDQPPGNGREPVIPHSHYVVDGTQLLLHGDDGRDASFGIVQPDAGSDGVLLIGKDSYLKRAPDPP